MHAGMVGRTDMGGVCVVQHTIFFVFFLPIHMPFPAYLLHRKEGQGQGQEDIFLPVYVCTRTPVIMGT